MAVLDAIKAIQDAMLTVSGIRTAPDYPSDGDLPAVITHLATGTITPGYASAGVNLELHNIVVELHVSDSGNLAASFEQLETLHALVVAELLSDVTFGGTLANYQTLTYSTTRTSWAGKPTLARVYTLNNSKIL